MQRKQYNKSPSDRKWNKEKNWHAENKLRSAYGKLLPTRKKSKGNNDMASENNRQLDSKPAMKNVARN